MEILKPSSFPLLPASVLFFILIGILSLTVFAGRYTWDAPVPQSETTEMTTFKIQEVKNEGMELSEKVKQSLIHASCAGCHTGSLSSSKPGALAIFDLEDENWYGKMKKEYFQPLVGRSENSDEFSTKEKADIVAFVKVKGDSITD